MAEYLTNTEDLTTVADAIRAKGGTSDPLEFPQGMADAVAAIEGGGGCDLPLEYAAGYPSMFEGVKLPAEATDIVMEIKNAGAKTFNMDRFGRYSNITSLKLSCKGNPLVNLGQCCYQDFNIQRVDFSGFPDSTIRVSKLDSMFYGNGGSNLTEIKGIFDCTECVGIYAFGEAFAFCGKLTTIRFKPDTIQEKISFRDAKSLSPESVQSVIDGLAQVEAAKTIILHPDIKAKLTAEQQTAIASKNWTLQ